MNTVIENALLLNGNQMSPGEVLFDRERILDVGDRVNRENALVVDAQGLALLPGLIDVHVHFREPGFTQKETIETGSEAALAGGFTTVGIMPNVRPYPDDPAALSPYLGLLKARCKADWFAYGCMTEEERGEEVVAMIPMREKGILWFSDDGGIGPQTDREMERVCRRAAEAGVLLALHCEQRSLEEEPRILFSGEKARSLGVRGGMTNEAETHQVRRYLEYAKKHGTRIHICHLSCEESLDLVRRAKEDGVDVSCEVSCHHLALTDRDFSGPDWKMSPPLKPESDRKSLIEGLKDGSIDCIASDHAPHEVEEKEIGIEKAPFGVVGLETSLSVLYTALVKGGILSLGRLIELMSEKPAKRFGLKKVGRIERGFRANVILVDFSQRYSIDRKDFFSKGKNTPFQGREVYGKVMKAFVDGSCRFERRS